MEEGVVSSTDVMVDVYYFCCVLCNVAQQGRVGRMKCIFAGFFINYYLSL